MSDVMMKRRVQSLGQGAVPECISGCRRRRSLLRIGHIGILGMVIVGLAGCATQATESAGAGQTSAVEQSAVSSDAGSVESTKVETVFSFEKQSRERYGDERMVELERGDDDSE